MRLARGTPAESPTGWRPLLRRMDSRSRPSTPRISQPDFRLIVTVHRAAHEREIVEFVKDHLDVLNHMPTAFLSLSLSEAGAEDEKAPPERRAQAASDVKRMIDVFLQETGWHPDRIQAAAGALLFTKYNFLLRFVMKRISRQAGGATDTSKDYEYTDWKALYHFVDEFVQAIPEPA